MSDAPGFKSILSMNVREFMDPSMVHVVWGLSKVRTSKLLHPRENLTLSRTLVRQA